jgi:hypothetical protein
MELDHLCKRRDCVNVEHLEPVTRWENIRRSDVGRVNRAKTHCPAGHPYEESNTRYDRRGSRYCLACKRRKRAEWGARKRAA